MKRVKCDLFGENEYVFFNVMRLMQLEKAIGCKIADVLANPFGLGDMMLAYEIGLKHEGKKRTAAWYAEKCDELFEEGVSLDELMSPIMKALIGSGVFGPQAYAIAFPEEVSEEEKEELKAKAELEKN